MTTWEKRRLVYGPSGVSTEGERNRQQKRRENRELRGRTSCKRGHPLTPGRTFCLECRRVVDRERRQRVGLIPAGMTLSQYGKYRAWATRRALYGPTGYKDGGQSQVARLLRHLKKYGHHESKKTHCKRGHEFTPKNTNHYRGARYCRACRVIRSRQRPDWVEKGGIRISVRAHDAFYLQQSAQLRLRMCQAHPDKGGTSKKFITAHKAWKAFEGVEQKWYAGIGLTPPKKYKNKG